MRVHELAKELNISSKEIIETLSNDTKKYTASNGLTDSEITSIRSKFGKKAAQPEKPKTEAKQEDKKSHISQVYFPQNSTKAPGNDTRKGNQNQTKNDNQMNNRNNNQNNNRKSDTPTEQKEKSAHELIKLFEERKLVSQIDSKFDLADIQGYLTRSNTPGRSGKVIITSN